MTATETMTTLRADELQPGDDIRLVGLCSVLGVETISEGRCLVHVRRQQPAGCCDSVWLWKYSRVEVLSDVGGRGHLVTPVYPATQDSESMEVKPDASV